MDAFLLYWGTECGACSPPEESPESAETAQSLLDRPSSTSKRQSRHRRRFYFYSKLRRRGRLRQKSDARVWSRRWRRFAATSAGATATAASPLCYSCEPESQVAVPAQSSALVSRAWDPPSSTLLARWLALATTRRNTITTPGKPLERLYRSDTALLIMPVGFENSALKLSFSLSSLQPPSCGASPETPEHPRIRTERPYHSLTKKHKRDPETESWRRSWNRDVIKDKEEFWAALQSNYNYLMDNQLIDTCKEASGELVVTPSETLAPAETIYSPDTIWTLADLCSQFVELYAWLDSVQSFALNVPRTTCTDDCNASATKSDRTVVDREERDEKIRANHISELQRLAPRRILFNDQAANLMDNFPDTRPEVSWRVQHLNAKWVAVEAALLGNSGQKGAYDLDREIRCLRKWLREMEARLGPVDLHRQWTSAELELRTREHMALQREIESQGRLVAAAVRFEKTLGEIESENEGNERLRGRRDARAVERRWQNLFLRALEWQCHLEALLATGSHGSTSPLSEWSDSDEEPLSKQPRLSSEQRTPEYHSAPPEDLLDGSAPKQLHNAISNVMDTTPPPFDQETCLPRSLAAISTVESSISLSPSVTSTVARLSGVAMRLVDTRLEGTRYDESNRNAPNYATFYFKHPDTDSEVGPEKVDVEIDEAVVLEEPPVHPPTTESSEEEWTYLASQKKSSVVVRLDFGSENAMETVNSDVEHNQEAIQQLVQQAEHLVQPAQSSAPKPRVFQPLPVGGEQSQKSTPGVINQAKVQQIREWLSRNMNNEEPLKKAHTISTTLPDAQPPLDSCDASCEYTTGDDEEPDINSEASSRGSSADLDHSTSAQLHASVETVLTTPCTPTVTQRVMLRRSGEKRRALSGGVNSLATPRDRPWSVHGLTIHANQDSNGVQPFSHFSISESALHEMMTTASTTTPTTVAHPPPRPLHLSSSMEEQSLATPSVNNGSRTSSLRRRKLRTRRRQTTRKSESGSDGVTMNLSGGSDQAKGSGARSRGSSSTESRDVQRLSIAGVSSQSFSGSDLALTTSMTTVRAADATSTDNSDAEGSRQKPLPTPDFRLGPTHPVSCMEPPSRGIMAAPGASPGSNGQPLSVPSGEEQLSSFSEQAWDNYQEKYLSETYSEEAPDSESARRLLEFGEDYGKFLDSDAASSLGASGPGPVHAVPMRRRKSGLIPGEFGVMSDSDSDLEELRHLVKQSASQLKYSEDFYTKQLTQVPPEQIQASDFAEFVATCKENINGLKMIMDNVEEESGLLGVGECKQIKSLVERWEQLQSRAEELPRVRGFQKEMAALKEELEILVARIVPTQDEAIHSTQELEARIGQVEVMLSSLRERKERMLQVNVAVHRFLKDSGLTDSQHKSEVAELYRLWDLAQQGLQTRLSALERAATLSLQIERQLGELEAALRGDGDSLRLLDQALAEPSRAGALPTALREHASASIRDVARLLSDKQRLFIGNDPPASQEGVEISKSLTEGGSLSDSGISDEGSELELSERERRLAHLKRLARALEQAAGDSHGPMLYQLNQRLEASERELRDLQRSCRELMVRTAETVDARNAAAAAAAANSTTATKTSVANNNNNNIQGFSNLSAKRARRRTLSKSPILPPRGSELASVLTAAAVAVASSSPDMGGVCGGSGPEDPEEPGKRRSGWIWRVVGASIPFQMALLALFCMACLLEPHCCDNVNSFGGMFTPQLRYVRGPPPA